MPLQCPKPVYQWHLQRVAIILNQEPDAFFPPKWHSFGNSQAKDRRQQAMATNARALTDRSFYSKLFHPPSDWSHYEDVQPLTLNHDRDTDNLMDLQGIDSSNLKGKLGSQVENTADAMAFQEDQKAKEIAEHLMKFDTGVDHGKTNDNQKSHQVINNTTNGNDYHHESPETELETQHNFSLETDEYAQYGYKQEASVDKDQNEMTRKKNSSPVINEDENEGVINTNYTQGYKCSIENSDEEEFRTFGNDHEDIKADNSANDKPILNTKPDDQDDVDVYNYYDDDADDDLNKTSNLADQLRINAASYEEEGENDVLDRGLGSDRDQEVCKTKAKSFLGLLSGSVSDSESENDLNF